MRSKHQIFALIGMVYIPLLCINMTSKTEAKSIGLSELSDNRLLSHQEGRKPVLPTPAFNRLLTSKEAASLRSFHDYLDDVLKREKHLKEDGVHLHDNSRQRRTILLKVFLFLKFIAKEVFFFGKFLG